MRLWENKVAADSPSQRPWENICKLSRPVLVISLRNKLHRFSTMQKLSALDNAKIMKPWTFPVLFSDYNFRKQNTNNETILYCIKIKQLVRSHLGGKWKINNYVWKTTANCASPSKNKSLHILHNSSSNSVTGWQIFVMANIKSSTATVFIIPRYDWRLNILPPTLKGNSLPLHYHCLSNTGTNYSSLMPSWWFWSPPKFLQNEDFTTTFLTAPLNSM